ncbi:nucleotide-binding oligomerization domain-containing protein 1 [Rhinatrema bivittatum]|uniref:nucleotide-binding oligomerization domain-containing protein 1 n=1 Tax=Rhinatrema bivittatum TaxID=194408 RepID=UPI00112DBDBC|nr:nucleotide-binding oligomerization domain-containing protein 1 [Rhinatrema bivittatum]XP_029445226.1 nucleotide-binding oligomerization domain-containing protein 1 [Rhinatrema bivittatum]
MEDQCSSNTGSIQTASVKPELGSFITLLRRNREILVSKIRNTQSLIDNLVQNDYFSSEDVDIASQFCTRADKVRKILDLVQCKGEEVSEYFIYILHTVIDAYYDLQPWLHEIGYRPSEFVQVKPVVNTDPVSQYTQKLRHEVGKDSKFIMSYAQKEEMSLQDTYTDTLMELVNEAGESLGGVNCLTALFDENGVINDDAEAVFVSGDAGVGKSILLQKMQNMWAKRESFLDVKFFFCFRCRTFSCFKKHDSICLKDLLFTFNCFPDQDPDEVFHFILHFPHTVLFTFDGFDEIHSDFDQNSIPEVFSPFDSTHPLGLLMHLLSGKLLKGSKKVLTARTGTEVSRKVIRKKVLLKGFSPENLQTYTRTFFKDQVFQKLVLNHLEANPSLCSLCSIPLFCWIIFKSYEHFLLIYDSQQLPDCSVSLTDIFLLITEVYLNRSVKTNLVKRSTKSQAETFKSRKETLLSLGRVAHHGMEKSLFVFDQDEITSLGVSENDLQLGFLRTGQGCGTSAMLDSTCEFFHVTLQSFFTALFLIICENICTEELLKYFNMCGDGEISHFSLFPLPCIRQNRERGGSPFQNSEHLQYINLFLCGLLSKPKQRVLQPLVVPHIIKRKRKALGEYLSNSMRSHFRNLPRCKHGIYKWVQAKPQFLWILRNIYETRSEKVGRLAAKSLCANYIKLTFCNAFSADCSAMSFVISHFRKQLALDLDNNNINDYGVKELVPCFSKLTVIRLSVNQITDHGVKVLSEELKKYKIITNLGLYRNQITDEGAKYVASIIEDCSSLTHLKIGCNRITTVGGKSLALAIQKSRTIFDVGMWGNKIGDEGAKVFADALRNHPSLSHLSLSCNGICTDGGKSIAEALQQNTSVRILWLTENELNDETAESFAEMLKVNRTLEHLWLIKNKITIKGAIQLREALRENTHIKEICLNGNLLEEAQFKLLEDDARIICF